MATPRRPRAVINRKKPEQPKGTTASKILLKRGVVGPTRMRKSRLNTVDKEIIKRRKQSAKYLTEFGKRFRRKKRRK